MGGLPGRLILGRRLLILVLLLGLLLVLVLEVLVGRCLWRRRERVCCRHFDFPGKARHFLSQRPFFFELARNAWNPGP